jgi:hypothetical protein
LAKELELRLKQMWAFQTNVEAINDYGTQRKRK